MDLEASGLDYGCGPEKAMQVLAIEDGKNLESYDPLFFADQALLEQQYDFVICSETVEHFYSPNKEFERLHGMLKPGGLLGVMTWQLTNEKHFAKWSYHNDQTHVCFYQPRTVEWLSNRWNWSVEVLSERVFILKAHS